MIELNLLPPQEKASLNLEQIRRWVLLYGGSLLLIALCFAAILCLIWFFILIQLKSYSQSLQNIGDSLQGQSVSRQKQLSSDFNKYLEKISNVQQDHKYYSSTLSEIANIIPSGVRVDSLSIDEKSQVQLAGWAPERSQVLLLQEALTKSNFFTNVEKPLANLTKPANINFNFKFTLKPSLTIK